MRDQPSDLWRRLQAYRASPLFRLHQGFRLKRFVDKTDKQAGRQS
jgi:hypothetical protein